MHAGGQYEWDSAAPVAVALAAGLHASRLDGSALAIQPARPLLPDILICPVVLAEHVLAAIARRRAPRHPVARRQARPDPGAPHCHAPTIRSPLDGRASDYSLSQLDVLEAESIHIMREVAAEFERPVLLFSGGKDSIVMLRAGGEGVLAGPDPVPGDARGHRAQLRRGDRVPGPAGRRGRACSWSWPRSRSPSTPGGWPRRPAGGPAVTGCRPPPLLDAIARAPLRRGVRRRPAGRGEGPGQGAGVLVPGRVRPVGPEEPASRAVEPLQHPDPPRASTSGCSRCPTGPSWTCGSTSPGRSWRSRRSTSPTSAQGVRAGRHAARRHEVYPARARTSRSSRPRCGTAPSAT